MYRKISRMCASINNVISFIEKIIMAVLLAGVIFVIFYQVIARYLLEVPNPWSEEVARYCFIWLCWIGSAYAIYSGQHIEINLIDSIVSRSKYKDVIIKIIGKLGIIITIAFMVYFAAIYGDYLAKVRGTNQLTTALRLHFSVPLAGVYIGGVLTIVQGVLALFKIREPAAETGLEYNEPDSTPDSV